MNAPSAPDPMQTAQAQASFNQQAAETQQALNMTNQVTPYGTLTYSLSPGADQVTKGWGGFGGKGGTSAFPGMYTATTALSGPMQKLFNIDLGNATTSAQIADALQRNVMSSAERPLDLSWGATEAKLAELNRNTLDPLWAQRSEQNTQNLYNQGVSPGSAAYDQSMRQFEQQKNDAYNQMFLQGHQTAISDILQQYNAPINAAAAWRSGGQIAPYQPNMGFVQTPQAGVQAPDYSGLVQQNYKTQAAANAQGMGGLFGLGGDLLKFGGQFLPVSSDRKDKTDIEKFGKDDETGLDAYAYRYKGDPKSYPKTIGVMAQDVEKKAPGAVKKIGGHRVIMEVV